LKQDFGITIEIQDPDRAAGLLVPDDLVTIFTAAKGDPTQIKQVVQNVRVISVGSKSSAEKNANESGLSSTILGLDVSVDDAGKIYRARAEGSLMVAVQGVPLVR
jgi:Flp pilus assembly protein CpaB